MKRIITLLILLWAITLWGAAGYVEYLLDTQESVLLDIGARSHLVGCVQGGGELINCKILAEVYKREFKSTVFPAGKE